MKKEFKQDIKVLSSMTDSSAKVGIAHALSYLQDNMCEYFRDLGCDGITMIPAVGCFWVVTKTKIKFNKSINWLDHITLQTFLNSKSIARLNIVNNILDDNGDILIEGLQEMCAMDSSTRKIRLISTTLFPREIEPHDISTELKFVKFDDELNGENLSMTTRVSSGNVDYFGHTNNVEYVRLILSTIDASTLKNLTPKTFEIHYILESREGDELSVFKKEIDDGYLFEIKSCERVCVKAMLLK